MMLSSVKKEIKSTIYVEQTKNNGTNFWFKKKRSLNKIRCQNCVIQSALREWSKDSHMLDKDGNPITSNTNVVYKNFFANLY